MGTHAGNVITLANSIVGVSVLAMPFCFKQCGILLATLMLLFSNIITRLACHYLMKSAIMEKRKNFEMLAFRVFGPTGKLIVELCIIGFMLGTCVAYFVIMGDLGPGIVGPAFGFQHPAALRPSVLIGIAMFVVLPLGLLKNVDSLSGICAVTLAFYFCLVLKVMGEAVNHLAEWDWMDKVFYWRPSGILQCIPIFSMALSCQTQLFEIFDSLPSHPLDRMNMVVRSAVNMVTLFYISVGFFGYVAYCDQSFAGNLMMNFSPTVASDVIKIGFLLSVAVSFPLVIFPCRASIHSLFFSKGYEHAQTGSAHIPESRFKCITLLIVTLSLVTGLLIPNIEIVLGLVGSTIGVIVCVIVPGVIFTSLSLKNNNEKLVAKFLVCTGVVIMVLGTYANLYATEEAVSGPERNIVQVKKNEIPILPKILEKVEIKDETLEKIKDVNELASLPELQPLQQNDKPKLPKDEKDQNKKKIEDPHPSIETKIVQDTKKEPPVPEEPVAPMKKESEIPSPKLELPLKPDKTLESKVLPPPEEQKVLVEQPKVLQEKPLELGTPLRKEELPKISENPVIPEQESAQVNKIEKSVDVVGLKEDIIDKIKEHEEAQRKLNEEGAKLLKEIKNYVNTSKDSLKLVNVKTGVVTDLKNNLSQKSDSVGRKDAVKEANEGLSNKMAQGIPLPLAVKSESNTEKIDKYKDLKKENEILDKRDLGRDLLGGDKELREKRDIEEVLIEETSGPKQQPASDIQPVTVKSQNSNSQEKNGSLSQAHKENDNSLFKPQTQLENCVKNNSKPESKVNDVMTNENNNKLDELIKSPSFLSDSKNVLNKSPQLLKSGEVNKGALPEMPKKRDLKSIEVSEFIDNKQNKNDS